MITTNAPTLYSPLIKCSRSLRKHENIINLNSRRFCEEQLLNLLNRLLFVYKLNDPDSPYNLINALEK